MRQAAQKMTSAEIRHFSPINKMSDDDAQELLRTAITNQLSAGTKIFGPDDDDKRTFYLIKGEIEITTRKKRKVTIKANTPQTREPMGRHINEQHSARASKDSILISFDADMMELFLNWTNPNAYLVNEINIKTSHEWVNRLLQSRGLLRFSEEQIQILIKRMKEVHFQAGDTIIQQNNNDDYYYIIKNGSCEVSRKPDKGSREIKLAELHEGDAFGEEALLTDTPRNATITMREDGDLMQLSKEDFSQFLAEPLLTTVSIEDSRDLVTMGAMFLDVRLPEEYALAHLPGSFNIPLALLRLKLKQLSHHRKYIICCGDGSRSTTAAFLMNRHGFDAFILDGGLATQELFEPEKEIKAEASNKEQGFVGPMPQVTPETDPAPTKTKEMKHTSFAEHWGHTVDDASDNTFKDNFDITPSGKTKPLVSKTPKPVKTTKTTTKSQTAIPSAVKTSVAKPQSPIDSTPARRSGRMLSSFLGLTILGIAAYSSLDLDTDITTLIKTNTPVIETNDTTISLTQPSQIVTNTPAQEMVSNKPATATPSTSNEILDLTPWLNAPENEITELVSEPDLTDLVIEQSIEPETNVIVEQTDTKPAIDPSTRGIKFN